VAGGGEVAGRRSRHVTEDSAQAIVLDSREALVTKFAEAVNVGITAVLEGLRDPKTRLGDRARALEVVAQQHALLVGDPTSRSENLNVSADSGTALSDEEARQRRTWLDAVEVATDDELWPQASATR
jgi:hypothetical protein